MPIKAEKIENLYEKALYPLSKMSDRTFEKKYWTFHKSFFKEQCRPGTEEKFWDLFKDFRGDGYFVPKTLDNKLDKSTISKYLPEYRKKKKWLETLINGLKSDNDLSSTKKLLKRLDASLLEITSLKEKYFEESNVNKKKAIEDTSALVYEELKGIYFALIKEIPYLLSYNYPLDHFQMRQEYDEVKARKDKRQNQKANEIYFYRKIVQDGAYNPNRSYSDGFLRATIDSLSLKFQKQGAIIDEDMRYDLESMIEGVSRQLNQGKVNQSLRLTDWIERTERAILFYENLLKDRAQINGKLASGEKLVEGLTNARTVLKDYINKKHAEAYKFWSEKEPAYQAMYALTTILYNEVGGIDYPHFLEREDVAKVVLNRLTDPLYNFIPKTDSLYSPLKELGLESPHSNWLNVLFKEGEFSFTYYFLHGAVRVFCPDMSKTGRKLRANNLKIILEVLRDVMKEGIVDFPGIRYFSRASMLGRIRMDRLWKNFRALPEEAGVELFGRKARDIKKAYAKGNYKYRYHFWDAKGRKLKVIEAYHKPFVVEVKEGKVVKSYSYRNPHFFRYFVCEETSAMSCHE